MIIDTNRNTYTHLSALKAFGVTDVIRYLSPATKEEKVIKPGEARALGEAGIRLGYVFETFGKPHGTDAGTRDGLFVMRWAETVGAHKDQIIWYAVDYDAPTSDHAAICAAFAAFKSTVSSRYRVGAYASGAVGKYLKEHGVSVGTWLTCSTGFAGTGDAIARGDYVMRQGLPRVIAGIDADPNYSSFPGVNIGTALPFPTAISQPTPLASKPWWKLW